MRNFRLIALKLNKVINYLKFGFPAILLLKITQEGLRWGKAYMAR